MQCLEIAKHFRIIYLLYLKPEICFGLSSRFISFMLLVVVVMMCVCVGGGGGGWRGGSNHMLGIFYLSAEFIVPPGQSQ